jgi:hypothetical protein
LPGNFFHRNYILNLALFLTIILIWDYIIKHQDMNDPLQQSYRNIVLGGEAFIESITSASGGSSPKKGFLKIFVVYINI